MKSLIEIQNNLVAPKDQRNEFGKYNYRNVESIMEAVKPLLQKFGAVIELTDDVVMIGERYYVKSIAKYKHESYETYSTAWARECDQKKGMDEAQITGSASSYARKYALCALLMIDGGDDPDKNDNTEKEEAANVMSNGNTLLAEAQKKIAIAKDIETLKKIWNKYQELHSNTIFSKCLTAKKEVLYKNN